MTSITGTRALLGAAVAALAALVTVTSAVAAQATPKANGHWEGTLKMPNQTLNIAVDLDKNPAGVWIGSMSVVASTSINVPLTKISVDEKAVRFTAALPTDASFEGSYSADAKGLAGTASNAQGGAPFELTRTGEANVQLPPASSAMQKEFEGTWEGAIDAGGQQIRVVLRLSAAPDGTAKGVLLSPDQGNLEMAATAVTITGKQLQMEVRSVSGSYRGTLGATGEITGEWTQGPNTLPLNLKRAAPEAKKP